MNGDLFYFKRFRATQYFNERSKTPGHNWDFRYKKLSGIHHFQFTLSGYALIICIPRAW